MQWSWIWAGIVTAVVAVACLAGYWGFGTTSNQNDLNLDARRAYQASEAKRSLCAFMQISKEQRDVEELGDTLGLLFQDSTLATPTQTITTSPPCTYGFDQSDKAFIETFAYTLPVGSHQQQLSTDSADNPVRLSLMALSNQFAVFRHGAFASYYLDKQVQLMAYSLKNDETRAYVVFNFSYDVHRLPLPMGFMASTKIKLWRTDAPKLAEFVTNKPLSIRAQSAVIVIVD